MTLRMTFTLDDDLHDFLVHKGAGNKSAYINNLLKQEKQRFLAESVMKANHEEAEDLDYRDELSIWDATLQDGLNPQSDV